MKETYWVELKSKIMILFCGAVAGAVAFARRPRVLCVPVATRSMAIVSSPRLRMRIKIIGVSLFGGQKQCWKWTEVVGAWMGHLGMTMKTDLKRYFVPKTHELTLTITGQRWFRGSQGPTSRALIVVAIPQTSGGCRQTWGTVRGSECYTGNTTKVDKWFLRKFRCT